MKSNILIALLAFSGNAIYSMDHALFAFLDNSASYDNNTTQQEQESSPGVSIILKDIKTNTKPEDIENPENYLEQLGDLIANAGGELYYNQTDAAKFDRLVEASFFKSTNNNTNQAAPASEPNQADIPTQPY